jgi:hypothetical protein
MLPLPLCTFKFDRSDPGGTCEDDVTYIEEQNRWVLLPIERVKHIID